VYTVAAMFSGDAGEGESLLGPLRDQGTLVTDFSGQMPYTEVQQLFDTVVHYDLSWNPTRHQQREGRVDRFGQPTSSPPLPLSSIWNFGGRPTGCRPMRRRSAIARCRG
jgi:hypothetical protein